MAKKKAADAEAGATPEAGKKKPAAKKKPPAKKSAPRKKRDTTVDEARSAALLEVGDTTAASFAPPVDIDDADDDADDVIEAEIVAETVTPTERREDTEETAVVVAPVSAEERELGELYAEEMSAPATVHAEYQDKQTRDEDRPMMPEINAREERKQHWQERRDRRKQRREERQQRREQPPNQNQGGQRQEGAPGAQSRPPGGAPGGRQRQPDQRQHDPRPAPQLQGEARAPINGHDDTLARVGTPLGDAAATVFSQLRNGQPLPVRQLAAMMRKRSLVQQDPEQLWPQLKAELLGDERSYRTLGLRPRIVYRGRDLFAPGPVSTSATADAEADVAHALSKLAGATHRALGARLARATPQGFERLIHAYLVAAGYRDIEWVKRVGGIAYASALAPGLERTVLISARSGDQPIDRRAIGELRVGVEAKDLVAGILFAPGEVSEDAEHELERAGRSIAVMCGDQLVATLVRAGVGVVSAAAPLHYVDDQLLDELLAG